MTDNPTTVGDNVKKRKTQLTPGKGAESYIIERRGSTSFFGISNKNGGAVPKELNGDYTTRSFAQTAINRCNLKRRKGA